MFLHLPKLPLKGSTVHLWLLRTHFSIFQNRNARASVSLNREAEGALPACNPEQQLRTLMHSDSKTLETGYEWVLAVRSRRPQSCKEQPHFKERAWLHPPWSQCSTAQDWVQKHHPVYSLFSMNAWLISFLLQSLKPFPSILVPCLTVEFRQSALFSAPISTYQAEYLLPHPHSFPSQLSELKHRAASHIHTAWACLIYKSLS